MTIKIPAYFSGFASKVDGSASLRFTTQEISPADFGEFKENLNEFGWLVFEKNASIPPDAPDEAPEQEGKSLSERLRAVLFVRWKQLQGLGQTEKDFESYRRMVMEAWIESVKSKLDQ